MQPAFAGTRATVAIPFGSRIVSTIPHEHRLVVNGSFGDRFVEGIYLHADHATPTIRMYDFGSCSEISVQDFKSYPAEFPFRDQSCLMRPSPSGGGILIYPAWPIQPWWEQASSLPGLHFRLPPARFVVVPHHASRHKVEPFLNHSLVLCAVIMPAFYGTPLLQRSVLAVRALPKGRR